jgi:hypothetical protein
MTGSHPGRAQNIQNDGGPRRKSPEDQHFSK